MTHVSDTGDADRGGGRDQAMVFVLGLMLLLLEMSDQNLLERAISGVVKGSETRRTNQEEKQTRSDRQNGNIP